MEEERMPLLLIAGLLLIPSLVLATSNQTTSQFNFQGIAFTDRNKKEIVYFEHHQVTFRGDRIIQSQTIYRGLDGKDIALLECDYRESLAVPKFKFIDYRDGYQENLVFVNDQLRMSVREKKGAELKSKSLKLANNLSASQGINELIKQNLAAIASGKEVKTQFIMPAKLSSFDFEISGRALDQNKVAVQIEIDNFLLKLFAPKLEMTYSRRNQRLLNYYGNSNLSTDDGDPQKVYIEYLYADGEA